MPYILLFILLFAAELAYFKVANYYNIIDKPNERSSHTKITLRGGGIIFYIGVFVYFLLEGFQYPWFFSGLTLISIISFADDIQARSSRLRLIVHFTSMILMFYQWGLFLLPWYFLIIALILCTGILNAYNFMDGINGITGGYSLVALVSLLYINNYIVSFVDNELLYIIVLSLLVFNFFNFRKKAKCFAGDIGAISIAFIIVFLLGMLVEKTGNFNYIILLAVYGVDTVLTIIHRLILKENIFLPHRKHLFQLMANEMKLSHLLVSSIYMFVQFTINLAFIYIPNKTVFLIITIIVLSVIYILIKKKYYHLHNTKSIQ